MIEERIVIVCPFKSRNERPQGKEMYTNIYLKNIAPEVSDEQLQKIVEEYGKVTSSKIMRVSVLAPLALILVQMKLCFRNQAR